MWITLLGEPGAGKTTLGQSLQSAGLGTYISGSALLDRYVEERRENWQEIRDAKHNGRRADPRLTHELLKASLAEIQGESAVILDGFPKSVDEAEMTKACVPGGRLDLAILLECRAAERVRRVRARLRCDRCGWVTSQDFESSPNHVGCGGALSLRADDHPIVEEMRAREDFTEPLVEFFVSADIVRAIDAEQDREAVFDDAIRLLRAFPQSAQ